MKYVVSWEFRDNGEDGAARSLKIFSKWSPSEGANFHEFVSRIDGRGGFAVVETDDPTLIAKDVALFAPFLQYSVFPVLEIAEGAAISMESVETRASIT